jgi:hypothetical protein
MRTTEQRLDRLEAKEAEGTRDLSPRDVLGKLEKHEAVCAERWKTQEATANDIKAAVESLRTLVLKAGGVLIVGMAGILLTLVMKLGGIK